MDILKFLKVLANKGLWLGILLLALFVLLGIYSGVFTSNYFSEQLKSFEQIFASPLAVNNSHQTPPANVYKSDVSYEQSIIDAARNVSPSVVSIVISKNEPVYDEQFVNPFGDNNPFGDLSPFDIQIPQYVQKGSKLQEIGAGSGFIVSADGLVLTNKHVVSDKAAEYTVFTNDEQKFSAKVLALDPVEDLAIIKIQPASPSQGGSDKKFTPVVLGDSSGIQIGQTAIAIGNALGQFTNTVSVGVVSGLGRTISASDQQGSFSETLEGIIQTDAAINAGNSGGPLVNLKGEVMGINTAMAQGADAIGFAIPINKAKKDIQQVSNNNKIVYPFLGVRYVMTDNGALVSKGTKGEPAVTPGSAAEKAGIKEKDVILEINGEKITADNSMATLIQKYNSGDKITLKILRDGKEINVDVTLGERTS